jgi:mutator protein MutT
MSEKYYSRLAVNLVLTRINENGQKEILLQLRQNTGYMDNMYDFACSGHVDKGESFSNALIREAKEEIGINITEEDLIFLAVNHDYQSDHVQVFFASKSYIGEPVVCEPEECGGLLWADIDELPQNIIPYVANVIEDIKLGIQFDDGDFTKLNKVKRK